MFRQAILSTTKLSLIFSYLLFLISSGSTTEQSLFSAQVYFVLPSLRAPHAFLCFSLEWRTKTMTELLLVWLKAYYFPRHVFQDLHKVLLLRVFFPKVFILSEAFLKPWIGVQIEVLSIKQRCYYFHFYKGFITIFLIS